VLIDPKLIDMPVMNGCEATGIIKDHFPLLPITALTAASFDDMDNYLSDKGFNLPISQQLTGYNKKHNRCRIFST
jgi:CheY-like chemotaxis protein